MLKRFQQLFSVVLCASLVWAASEGAHAAEFFYSPAFILPISRLAFLHNQERMRLETQALSEQAASSTHEILEDPGTRPFWGRLGVRWNSLALADTGMSVRDSLRRQWPSQIVTAGLSAVLSLVYAAWSFPDNLAQGSQIVFPSFLALQILDMGWRVLLGLPLRFNLSAVCCGLAGGDRSVEGPSPVSLTDPVHPVMKGEELAEETRVTGQRGRHQAGAAIRLQYRDNDGILHYKIIEAKVSNEKRSDLVELLEQEIRKKLRIEKLKNPGIEYPARIIELRHTRLSTGSDPTIPDEAHPYVGEASHREATLYRKINGAWRLIKDTVQIAFVHNGIFSNFTWFNGDVIKQEDLKKELIQDLQDPKNADKDHPSAYLDADSPVAAMVLTLLRAQFDAYAALRLGRKMLLSGAARKKAADPAVLNRWKTVFEGVISEWIEHGGNLDRLSRDPRSMGTPEGAVLFERLHQAFTEAQRENPEFMKEFSASDARLMLYESLDAFLHNNLFRAMQIFSQRAMTSFGVGALSSVDENPVFFAKTQGLSLARNKAKKWRAWGSESMALTLAEPDAIEMTGQEELPRVYDERLDLDFVNGQVAEFFEDAHTDIFDVKDNRLLSFEETEKRWFNMKDSQWTSPLKRDKPDRPAKVDNDELAAHLRKIDRMWTNPDGSFNKKSVNCIVAQNLAKQIIQLARKEKAGTLGVKTHFLSLGFHTDGTHARNLVEFLGYLFPGMISKVIDSNEFLSDPERLLEETQMANDAKGETVGFPIDFYGAAYSTTQGAMPRLTRELSHIIALTGGVDRNRDTNLARLMGQDMPLGSDFAGNVLTNGTSWPRTQAQSIPGLTMHASINYLLIYLIVALREAQANDPSAFENDPLKLKYTLYDARRMLQMQRKGIGEIALITGVDADGKTLDSQVHRDLENFSEKTLAREGDEPRRQRWLYRTFILVPFIYFGIHYGWTPFSWLMHILPHGSLIPAATSTHFTTFVTQHFGSVAQMILWIVHYPTISALDDAIIATATGLIFYVGMSVVVAGFLRAKERRQLYSRQGRRFIGFAINRMWYLAEDYWKNIFGVSQADATFQFGGGDVVGLTENHFLKRWKSELNRGSIVINVRGDDRIPLFDDSAGDMTSNLASVNRNISMRKFFDLLNDYVFKFAFKVLRFFGLRRNRGPFRISYPGARILALGRHWPENSNETWRITLPANYFPLPRPQEEFLDRMEKQLGMTFDGEARARFFDEIEKLKKEHLAEEDMYAQGIRVGGIRGIPVPEAMISKTPLYRFARAFEVEDGKLFHWSDEDQASFERLQRWTIERMHPQSDLVALYVLGEHTGHLVNNPTNLSFRSVEVGTQDGAFFDTTPTAVSAARALDPKAMQRPIKLLRLHVAVPDDVVARVDVIADATSGTGHVNPVPLCEPVRAASAPLPDPFRKIRDFFAQQPSWYLPVFVIVSAIALLLFGILIWLFLSSHSHVVVSLNPPRLGLLRWLGAGAAPMIPYWRPRRSVSGGAPRRMIAAA